MTKNHEYERGKVEVGIAYGDDFQKAKELIIDVLNELKEERATEKEKILDPLKAPVIILESFGDSSVNIAVWVWVPVKTKGVSLSMIRERVYISFNVNNISIPFPQQDLYIKQLPDSLNVKVNQTKDSSSLPTSSNSDS